MNKFKNFIFDVDGVFTDGSFYYTDEGKVMKKFGDADNSNWVALKGPATTGSDLTIVLPNSYGTNGQVLQGDGSGNLSWGSPGINVTNDVSTANNNNFCYSAELLVVQLVVLVQVIINYFINLVQETCLPKY